MSTEPCPRLEKFQLILIDFPIENSNSIRRHWSNFQPFQQSMFLLLYSRERCYAYSERVPNLQIKTQVKKKQM